MECLTIYVVGASLLGSFGNSVMDIPKSNIVYKLDIDEKVKLDDRTIRFTNIIYEKNGNMNITYEYYNPKFWANRWTFGGMREISYNLGNHIQKRFRQD